MEATERVCPKCGTQAGSEPFCSKCGLNLARARRLPSRQEWEDKQAASAAARAKLKESLPAVRLRALTTRFSARTLVAAGVVAVAIIVVAVVVLTRDSGDFSVGKVEGMIAADFRGAAAANAQATGTGSGELNFVTARCEGKGGQHWNCSVSFDRGAGTEYQRFNVTRDGKCLDGEPIGSTDPAQHLGPCEGHEGEYIPLGGQ